MVSSTLNADCTTQSKPDIDTDIHCHRCPPVWRARRDAPFLAPRLRATCSAALRLRSGCYATLRETLSLPHWTTQGPKVRSAETLRVYLFWRARRDVSLQSTKPSSLLIQSKQVMPELGSGSQVLTTFKGTDITLACAKIAFHQHRQPNPRLSDALLRP